MEIERENLDDNLFVDWIKALDKRMRSQGRNVIMLLDNATSHPNILQLTNMQICFLPKNTKSVLQPLDQGILQNMKMLYRKRLVRSVLSKIGDEETVSAEPVSKGVTALNSINLVSGGHNTKLCREVCFVDAGIPLTRQHEEYENGELVEIMGAAQGKIHNKEPLTTEDYAVIDQDAPIHEELDSEQEKELVNTVKDKNKDESEILEVEDEDDAKHNPEQPILSHKEALQMV